MSSESDDAGLHDEVKKVTIRTFSDSILAELAAANLEAHGIPCWINSDDAGGMLPSLTTPGGVRLQVRVSDAEAAVALLNTPAPAAEFPDGNGNGNPEVAPLNPAPPKPWAPGQIFAGVVIGALLTLGISHLLFEWRVRVGTTTRYHYTADGKRDEAWVYRDGYLTEHQEDQNLDGKWDYWAYHEHGEVVKVEMDNNFDGKPDETWFYSNGALLKMEMDTDFNGIPDAFFTYKYHVLQEADMKPNGSTFVTMREFYKNGVYSEVWRGGDSHGHFKEIVHYDPFWNAISTNAAPFELLTPPQ